MWLAHTLLRQSRIDSVPAPPQGNSSECCQLSLALTEAGKRVVMWWHVFDPHIRDHAVGELSLDGRPGPVRRATFDDWRVDGCPHHGPSIAFASDGTRHQAWFNVREGAGGIFYAHTNASGALNTHVRLGADQAKQPELAVDGKTVALVRKQFNGKSTALMARLSNDGGRTWTERALAQTANDSGRLQLLQTASG